MIYFTFILCNAFMLEFDILVRNNKYSIDFSKTTSLDKKCTYNLKYITVNIF